MECKNIVYSGHAVRRMFERKITEKDISEVIESGELIDQYPNDVPYPSYLLLGFPGTIPIHVLIAKDDESDDCYVVTTYVPRRDIWNSDFKTRRTKS
jgi:hypothetical protein